ncbi:unnamed protein product [Cuscuta europaea]|uniref:Uncharacterized protein n=1 Tax=Cuscuta europaea TaxID=41803 RepID=A0A9P1DZ61_CUSEU|nr:unnamed protein product [Cuscuta europaea]
MLRCRCNDFAYLHLVMVRSCSDVDSILLPPSLYLTPTLPTQPPPHVPFFDSMTLPHPHHMPLPRSHLDPPYPNRHPPTTSTPPPHILPLLQPYPLPHAPTSAPSYCHPTPTLVPPSYLQPTTILPPTPYPSPTSAPP